MPTFVDSNVLVYARDPVQPGKQERAQAWLDHLWRSQQGRVSMQVLAEFYVTTTGKLRPGLAPEDARDDVTQLLSWRPVVIDRTVLRRAWDIEDRFRISFSDALIVSAGKAARCDRLLTEDLQDGMDFGGVVVVNPFRTAPPGE